MAFTVGDSIVEYISHIVGGSAVTGATFTVISAVSPAGAFTPTVTEIGLGVYSVTFSATHAGTWYLLLADAAQSPDVFYELSVDVDAATTSTPGTSPSTTTGGISRGELRRLVGERLGDSLICTCTSLGSTTEFKDYLRLALPTGSLKNRILYVSSGTAANVGQQRRVVTNVDTTATVTFTPALPATTAEGDVIELYRMNDQGPVPDEIHRAINAAILDVADEVYEAQTGIPAAFAWDEPVIDVPDEWHVASGADYLDPHGEWQRIRTKDFQVDRANRTVELMNRGRDLAHGRSVRLRGYTRAAELALDSDETRVDTSWLVAQAASYVCFGVAMRQSEGSKDRWERRALDLQKLADIRRNQVPTRITGRFAVLEPA